MSEKKLGRYEIIGELGKGAMGQVFLGKDPLIGRKLALKTFRVGFSAKDKELEQFRARFLREAQSAGILNHPNIVTVHDVAIDPDGDFFIAMEYVQGTDLKHLMQKGRLELPFIVQIVAQIADGLDFAHAKGVVHRDIKPANIIITKEQQAKITDFGIARVDASNLTTEGQLLGTPNYMAPEQIQARPVDHRTDLFSLGVMLFELVTGKKPFAGESLTQVTHRIVNEPHPRPDELAPGLPQGIVQVIDRALAKNPDERYQRGSEIARELRTVFAPRSASGTGSFLSDDPPTGAVPIQSSPMNRTMTSADAHAALKPPSGTAAMRTESAVFTPSDLRSKPPATQPLTVPESSSSKGPLMISAIVAGLLVVLALGFTFFNRPQEPTSTSGTNANTSDPMAAEDQEFEEHVATGQRLLLEQGDASAAQVALERALTIRPESREARQLSRLAGEWLDSEPEEVQKAANLHIGQRALDDRDYRTALAHAEAVLTLDPKDEAAQTLADTARERQEQRNKVRDRFRNDTASAPPPEEDNAAQTTPPPPATPPVAAPPAVLDIRMESELAEGRITLFADADEVLKESFKYRKRRSGGVLGGFEAQREIPSDNTRFGIYVWVKEENRTRTMELDADLAPGGRAELQIRILGDGRVAAKIVPAAG